LEIDKTKLTENNGKDGKPAYVAFNGKIYNVTESKMWKKGLHMNRHQAGQDLTEAIGAAPHGSEVLTRFKEVGSLEAGQAQDVRPPLPNWLNNFFEKYPFFKRHPHPMVVHFPMAFFMAATILLFWYYVISPERALLDSIFYMHILGTLSFPVTLLTGWLSWQVNYLGKTIGNITRKIIFSFIILIFDIIVLISITGNLELLVNPQGFQIVIPILIFLYLPIVAYIGQQGGDLVY
jgi:predicted heme/steroid binding protein